MIIITLKNGIVGVERIATDEEVILKDYDLEQLPADVMKDELGYYTKEEL